jgi:hypothetical protein
MGKEQYPVETLSRFAALKNLDDEADANSAWETIRENIKISAKESVVIMNLRSISHGSKKGAQNY